MTPQPMIDIKNGYDSLNQSDLCDKCLCPILSNPKTLIGTGNSLLLAFHPYCWLQLIQDFNSSHSLHSSFTHKYYL